jgi:hypothetical protein
MVNISHGFKILALDLMYAKLPYLNYKLKNIKIKGVIIMVDKLKTSPETTRQLDHDQDQAHLNLILHQQLAARNLESCWMEGYYYGQQGADESSNPFKHDTVEHQYYSDGWWGGFYQEEALFPEHAFEGVTNEAVNEAYVKEVGLREREAVGVRSRIIRNGGILAGLAIAASIVGVVGVTLLDAA